MKMRPLELNATGSGWAIHSDLATSAKWLEPICTGQMTMPFVFVAGLQRCQNYSPSLGSMI